MVICRGDPMYPPHEKITHFWHPIVQGIGHPHRSHRGHPHRSVPTLINGFKNQLSTFNYLLMTDDTSFNRMTIQRDILKTLLF